MDKQQMIDKAINELKGKLPNGEAGIAYLGYFVENSTLYKNWVGTICVVGEFTQRAKELGWINGYKYGIEYETNGREPDLDGDVLVEQFSTADDKWHTGSVFYWNWNASSIKKFRIIDDRFKPKVDPINQSSSNPLQLDNSWHERGELPPVGVECEVSVLDQGYFDFEVRGYYQGKVWMASAETGDIVEIVNRCKFRPIKSDREKFIEIALKCGSLRSRDGAKTVYGNLFDAGFRAPE